MSRKINKWLVRGKYKRDEKFVGRGGWPGGIGNNKREQKRKKKKIIKLMKKHKNKVKRNNAIIMKKTEK